MFLRGLLHTVHPNQMILCDFEACKFIRLWSQLFLTRLKFWITQFSNCQLKLRMFHAWLQQNSQICLDCKQTGSTHLTQMNQLSVIGHLRPWSSPSIAILHPFWHCWCCLRLICYLVLQQTNGTFINCRFASKISPQKEAKQADIALPAFSHSNKFWQTIAPLVQQAPTNQQWYP